MSSKVRDTDKGLKKVLAELKKLGLTSLKVGVQGQEASDKKETGDATPSSVSLLTVAAANEFGTETIPERSFLRSTMDKNKELNRRRLAEVVGLIADKKGDPKTLLNKVGVALVADVQKTITEGGKPFVPNAPATVAKKGSSSPLIDTGQLRQSITYVIDDEKVKK